MVDVPGDRGGRSSPHRHDEPDKRYKFEGADLKMRRHWDELQVAYEDALSKTSTKWAPWHILLSDDKKRARLNCIHHILSLIPYKTVPHEKVKLPKRSDKGAYDDQATLEGRRFVKEKY